jgi:predicted alpha/beta hydrolase family esterase
MVRIADCDILIVPGLGNSDEDHWQSRWETRIKTARRVRQDNWDVPERDSWVASIRNDIKISPKPVVIIAHSLGVHAVVHAVADPWDLNIKGAFLVAPPSEVWLQQHSSVDRAFVPVPRAPLRFPSVLVGSRNDEHGRYEDIADLALAWGSKLVDAGEAGHVNTRAGFGPWPEGMMSFAGFMSRL